MSTWNMSEETTSYWLCVYKDKPVVYYWMAWSSWHLSLWLHFQLSRLGLSNVSVHCLKQTNQWDCTWNNTQPTIKPPCRASATPPETLFFLLLPFFKDIRKAHSTCILCLGSFGVVSTHLQVQELHYLLFESHTGPHIHPDIQYGREQLLAQVTHPHPTVHGRGSQEDVESRDEVLQYRQVFLLPNTITGVWEKKEKQ